MRNRTNRLNRLMLGVVGVILVLAGAGGVLLSTGIFGAPRRHRSIMDPHVLAVLDRDQRWIWWVIGAVALVLAIAALYWLVVQLRVERIGAVELDSDRLGDSMIAASALTDAVRAEVETLPEVERARARLMRGRDDPELILSVWLREGVDLAALRSVLEAQVLAHARQALGRDRLRTWLRVEVDAARRERVR